MSLEVWSQCVLAVGSLMVFLWLWSVVRRDVSVVDPWWSMGFLLVSAVCFRAQELALSKACIFVFVASWALRLWAYLLYRNWGKGEDPRYTRLREKYGRERYWWFSLFQVFGLQGVLILLVSLPLQLALQKSGSDPIVQTDLIGAALFVVGFYFEVVADAQMLRFKSNPDNKGKVLDQGLWRYTRHPNYFGEFLITWGFWCFCLDVSYGALAIASPLLMSFLLLRVSGVTMLEDQLKETKPKYADYIKRTSTFFPWPPKEIM